MVSPDKIKHFVIVRFFPYQRSTFPHDVLDVDFLSKQLPLTKNILSSLENQTNKNFELVFLINEKCFSESRYGFVFSALRDSSALPIKFIKSNEKARLIKEASKDYDFVIQSRMDFDDFVFKDAIADTQSKVIECNQILAYGYCKGYRYVLGELYPNFSTFGGKGPYAVLASLICDSAFASKFPDVSVYQFPHDNLRPTLKNFLEKKGISFSENMFQLNTKTIAYIYFKHEFSQQLLCTNKV